MLSLSIIWDCFRPEDGKTLKPICLLQLCRIWVIIYDWFGISWLKKYCNFGFDHFNMSWRKMGIWGLVNCLLGNAGPFASGDWILPDLTIQGSTRLNYPMLFIQVLQMSQWCILQMFLPLIRDIGWFLNAIDKLFFASFDKYSFKHISGVINYLFYHYFLSI